MCAISGSTSFEKAFKLYNSGLERGHYGSGLLVIYNNDCMVIKQQNVFTEKDITEYLIKNKKEALYFAFHSRAPTNTVQKEWQYETTHPFNFNTFYVAHNGIINNFNTFPEHSEFDVDTSIIPYHLHINDGDISKTYSKYNGLLTSWVFESSENKFNLIKAGSSLFRDKDSFSSVSFEGSVYVERDGIIYELGKDRNLHEISDFEYTNPYFIL